MKKIAVLNSQVEARALEAMLKEQGIPFVLHTYRDSALDGLFQDQDGWGHIEALEDNEAEILAVLQSLRKGAESADEAGTAD